jgi:hypothetical protein
MLYAICSAHILKDILLLHVICYWALNSIEKSLGVSFEYIFAAACNKAPKVHVV